MKTKKPVKEQCFGCGRTKTSVSDEVGFYVLGVSCIIVAVAVWIFC